MTEKVLITKSTLGDIADAIREKNKSTDTYTPAEMVTAIGNIPSGTVTLKRGVLRPDAEFVTSYSYDKHLYADEEIEPIAYTTTSTTCSGKISTYTFSKINDMLRPAVAGLFFA